MLQCFNSVSNKETDVTPNFIDFAPLQHINKLLTYADVLCCYGMTAFVDVHLARVTSHADSVWTLPSEISNRLGLLCH